MAVLAVCSVLAILLGDGIDRLAAADVRGVTATAPPLTIRGTLQLDATTTLAPGSIAIVEARDGASPHAVVAEQRIPLAAGPS